MPSPAPKKAFNPALLVFAAALFLVVLYVAPRYFSAPLANSPLARLTLETQMRDTLAKLFLAAVALSGAAQIWSYLQKLGVVVENSALTLAAAERTAFFAAQQSETERYARAMAMLGDAKIEVRLGGIYALERLARESERDHGPITEVLAAFAREGAKWNEGEVVPSRTGADVQAILTVIGRRHAPFDRPEARIDLHGTALARAYLPYANLQNAFLYESNMDGAMLQGANLRGAWCWKSSFAGATLEGAHLEGADLTAASGLTVEQVSSAYRDGNTKLPDHLRSELSAIAPLVPSAEETRAEADGNLRLPTKRAV